MFPREPRADEATTLFPRLWARIGGAPLRHPGDAAAPSAMQASRSTSSSTWADTVIEDDRRVAPTDDANHGPW